MLAKYYRFRIYNATKTALVYANGAQIEVTFIPWKVGVGSVLEYGTEVKQNTAFLNTGETIAAHGQTEGAIIDNSSDLYIGLNGTIKVITNGITELGHIRLYVETSSDGVVWPSDVTGFKVTSLEELKELVIKTKVTNIVNMTNFEL